jgi:hypothetical protein
MSRRRVPLRVALAVCVLALLGLAAAATAVGFLVEAHRQQSDRDRRLAAAAAYVEHAKAQAETTGWHALTEKLAALQLSAQLITPSASGSPSTEHGPTPRASRRGASRVASNTTRSNPIAVASTVRMFSVDRSNPAAGQPTATTHSRSAPRRE